MAADDLAFAALQLPAAQPALLFAGLNAVNGGNGNPFGDGLRCAGGSVVRLGVRVPDANGNATYFKYDIFGREVERSNALGNTWTDNLCQTKEGSEIPPCTLY